MKMTNRKLREKIEELQKRVVILDGAFHRAVMSAKMRKIHLEIVRELYQNRRKRKNEN